MNTDKAAAYPCAGDWTAIEARFRRAKQALLDTQERHCEAAHEFLLAREQVRRILEEVFPGAEADSSQPVPEVCCGRNRAAATERPRSSNRGHALIRTQEEVL